mmetsp:Transcript_5534/g.15180  ORF Transcript_5534/g.15180 Transcript_5534/m.15180 type:complete len:113 (-) Transcript_5534:241-579(-)
MLSVALYNPMSLVQAGRHCFPAPQRIGIYGYGKGSAVRQVYDPLMGRAAALRIRSRFEELCIVGLYYATLEGTKRITFGMMNLPPDVRAAFSALLAQVGFVLRLGRAPPRAI